MCFTLDLTAYFARIGDVGSREPTLDTLNRVIEAHVRTIPFENLDILLGRRISLEAADIERKLVHEKRGGYCFEQNTLLMHALLGLGYSVRPISARVRIKQPRNVKTGRRHMWVSVTQGGENQSCLRQLSPGPLPPRRFTTSECNSLKPSRRSVIL